MTVFVRGHKELMQAFDRAAPEMKKSLRKEMAAVAEPVAKEATRLALTTIPKVTTRWAAMRVGVTQKSVYVVPRARGVRGGNPRKRPLFSNLVMDRAMEPALNESTTLIEAGLDRAFTHVERDWSR